MGNIPLILFLRLLLLIGVLLLPRLPLGLKNLRELKFEHSFEDTINGLHNRVQDIESSAHFFLQCLFFINERYTVLSTIRNFD